MSILWHLAEVATKKRFTLTYSIFLQGSEGYSTSFIMGDLTQSVDRLLYWQALWVCAMSRAPRSRGGFLQTRLDAFTEVIRKIEPALLEDLQKEVRHPLGSSNAERVFAGILKDYELYDFETHEDEEMNVEKIIKEEGDFVVEYRLRPEVINDLLELANEVGPVRSEELATRLRF